MEIPHEGKSNLLQKLADKLAVKFVINPLWEKSRWQTKPEEQTNWPVLHKDIDIILVDHEQRRSLKPLLDHMPKGVQRFVERLQDFLKPVYH